LKGRYGINQLLFVFEILTFFEEYNMFGVVDVGVGVDADVDVDVDERDDMTFDMLFNVNMDMLWSLFSSP
jgi:hypothetical protein